MDDSFAFKTTVPLHRQLDPMIVKGAVFGTLVMLGVGVFAHWVVASERESFSRTSGRAVQTEAPADRVDGLAGGSTAADAEEATEIALRAAKTAFSEHRSFLDAGPSQLSILEPGDTLRGRALHDAGDRIGRCYERYLGGGGPGSRRRLPLDPSHDGGRRHPWHRISVH